ncbi:MAG: hypothetical protein JSS87_00230 [Acidobacteria bacterium]|nr:hypothetical protein [Acidobacteriota bacterium]
MEFAEDGSMFGISPVASSQVAKEEAEALMRVAKDKGGAVVGSAVASFGLPLLSATALLIVGWFMLNAVSIDALFGKLSFSFWQVLGFVNAGNAWDVVMAGRGGPGAGIYGFCAFLAILGPFLRFFWKDRRASLAGMLPLVFMLFVWLMVHSSLQSITGGAVEGPFADVQRQARDEMMKAISLGMGTYVSLAASLWLAAMSAKNFLFLRASERSSAATPEPVQS